jgi:hypothetical protein
LPQQLQQQWGEAEEEDVVVPEGQIQMVETQEVIHLRLRPPVTQVTKIHLLHDQYFPHRIKKHHHL